MDANEAAFHNGYDMAMESCKEALDIKQERIAELEAEVERLKTVIYDTAHVAGTLGSGSDGWLRGRFMSISNALNAAIDRAQSSHGEHYDNSGKIIERG